jgi:hypothetical protein
MPILFIHGVNNRDSGCDYFRERGMRREMFDRLVITPLKGRFPSFAVSEDAYWGDIGASYRWGLRSVPTARILGTLGTLGGNQPAAGELGANPDLLMLLADFSPWLPAPASSELGVLTPGGGDGLLVAAARQDPASMIRAIVAPERVEPQAVLPGGEPELEPARQASCEGEGRERARIILAADEVARSEDVSRRLRTAATDEAVLAVMQEETTRQYEKLTRQAAGGAARPQSGDLEVLGIGEVFAAGARRIEDLIAAARNLAQRIGRGAAREANLAVLGARRERITRQAAVFFGDVFEYLRRGQVVGDQLGTIALRVADFLLAAGKVARERKEPLVLVTHSFGSAIAYDLLTSPLTHSAGEFKDLYVDLWVMAGSQAAVFAEMRAYLGSPGDVPSTGKPTLGRPAKVGRWLNFYDAADVFGFLAEPVFGTGEVSDVEVRESVDLRTAHSAYFATPSFYRRIADELLAVL